MTTRIQLSRAKGWRKPEGAVVVARPSIWGNPWAAPCYLHTPKVRYGLSFVMTVETTINQFRLWVQHGRVSIDMRHFPDNLTPTGRAAVHNELELQRTKILTRLPELRGRDLCCWCTPANRVHGGDSRSDGQRNAAGTHRIITGIADNKP